jgi:hypothetical protein
LEQKLEETRAGIPVAQQAVEQAQVRSQEQILYFLFFFPFLNRITLYITT